MVQRGPAVLGPSDLVLLGDHSTEIEGEPGSRERKAITGLLKQRMKRLEEELLGLKCLIAEQQQSAEAVIRRWLRQRDPNFTAAEVDEQVLLVKRELSQL